MLKFTILALAAALAAGTAQAGEFQPISMAAYQTAAAAGRPIVFHVRADWCPASKAQDAVLARLMAEPAYKDYLVLDVDFDHDKKALEILHVERQGMLIVNRGPVELGRATGLLKDAEIVALVAKAQAPAAP